MEVQRIAALVGAERDQHLARLGKQDPPAQKSGAGLLRDLVDSRPDQIVDRWVAVKWNDPQLQKYRVGDRPGRTHADQCPVRRA